MGALLLVPLIATLGLGLAVTGVIGASTIDNDRAQRVCWTIYYVLFTALVLSAVALIWLGPAMLWWSTR
jgi:hypothetical protein